MGCLGDLLLLEELDVDEVVLLIKNLGKSLKAKNDAGDERLGIKVTELLDSDTKLF